MKRNILITSLTLVVGILTSTAQDASLRPRAIRVASQPRAGHTETNSFQVVVLSGVNGYYSSVVTNGSVITYTGGPAGGYVWSCDGSAGAPGVPSPVLTFSYDPNVPNSVTETYGPLTSYSQTLANLLNDGFEIVNTTADNTAENTAPPTVLLVKRPAGKAAR
jgi:hypothetical protein